ncbi:acylphosphatase [Pseudoramibacter faecis]|uniref:acylphosphatase n=1 Tax=Pseudoramibacter faecis TaxID=3108534 RepID=UPI002E79AA04|nr:acylphosphatase [Pseudoramibacter sp. HA2172]
MLRYYLQVFGRVQGVGFRYTAVQLARAYALTGWARNCYDGSVELEIQGDPANIDLFIGQLNDHRWIRIDRIIREKRPLSADERDFCVRY